MRGFYKISLGVIGDPEVKKKIAFELHLLHDAIIHNDG